MPGVSGVLAPEVVAVFQPVVELRGLGVVGYEALARPSDGSSPEELFAAARAAGQLGEVDRACRTAALDAAAAAGLGAPFALFLNADADALELDLPELPHGSATLILEITEQALTERPEAVLRTLTRLRTRGWGVSLDDVGADSRSLAVMPLVYPDVIKLDLRLLGEREPADLARVVTAVGAEAERRHATVLAEGIDTPATLELARAVGRVARARATCSASRRRCPPRCRSPGRPLRLAGAGADFDGPLPFQRVTNWKRPVRGSLALAERAAALLTEQAAALGPTGMLLAAPDLSHASERFEELRDALGFVGVLERGRPGGHVDRGRPRPGLRGLLRGAPRRRRVAVRDVLRPRAGRRVRAAAHGAPAARLRDDLRDLRALPGERGVALRPRRRAGRSGSPRRSARRSRTGARGRPRRGWRRSTVGRLDRAEVVPGLERARARDGLERVGQRVRVVVGGEALVQDAVDRLAPLLRDVRGAVGVR